MSITSIFLLILIIVIFSFSIIFFINGKRYQMEHYKNNGFRFLVTGVLALLVFSSSLHSSRISKEMDRLEVEYEEMIKKIEENAANLTFYLDGEEVLFDNIDIRQYQVSYDTTSNKVFLAQKVESTNKISSFIPIFMPRL